MPRFSLTDRICIAFIALVFVIVGWALITAGRPAGCKAYTPDCLSGLTSSTAAVGATVTTADPTTVETAAPAPAAVINGNPSTPTGPASATKPSSNG
jgi:hypothetical protein